MNRNQNLNPNNKCDRCEKVRELFHYDPTGEALCDKCTPGECLCGCGTPSYSNYRPGHDAKHVSVQFKKLQDLDLYTSGAQAETNKIFAELASDALRAKLGRMVDNSKDGLYNGFGDAGIEVPFSENPSLARK